MATNIRVVEVNIVFIVFIQNELNPSLHIQTIISVCICSLFHFFIWKEIVLHSERYEGPTNISSTLFLTILVPVCTKGNVPIPVVQECASQEISLFTSYLKSPLLTSNANWRHARSIKVTIPQSLYLPKTLCHFTV